MTHRLTASLAMLILFAGPAGAACTPPVPPAASDKPAKPQAPVKGPCVDAKTGTPGCLGWEAHRFNEDVKAYNAGLPAFQKAAAAYLAKLNAYVAAASDFARCEVDTLR